MNTTDSYGAIIAAVMKMMNQINQLESRPKRFGTDVAIYRSEIHTIAAIGAQPGCKVSELANALGIAKPSVTEIVRKLVAKGLIEKYQLPNNRKEVRVRLTPKGATANQGHTAYHADMYARIYAQMERLPAQVLVAFKASLDAINAFLTAEIGGISPGDAK